MLFLLPLVGSGFTLFGKLICRNLGRKATEGGAFKFI
jgi:hypothetical protein